MSVLHIVGYVTIALLLTGLALYVRSWKLGEKQLSMPLGSPEQEMR